MSNKVQEHVKL